MENEAYGSIHHTLHTHEEKADTPEFKKKLEDKRMNANSDNIDEYFSQLPDGRRVFNFEKCKRDEDGHLAIDFDKLIATRDALEIQNDIGYGQALSFLQGKGKIDELYNTTFNNIKKDTHYLQDLEEIGTDAYVISGLVGDRVGGKKIKWDKKDFISKIPTVGTVVGFYSSFTNKITILKDRPDKNSILKEFLEEGEFPIAVSTIAHEAVHAKQFPLALLSNIKNILYGDVKIELHEAQAHHQGNGALSAQEIKFSDIFEIIGQASKQDRDKLIYAIHAVRQLDALGFTVAEVAKIIDQSDGWDARRFQYHDVQEAIDIKLAELGLDEYDLENLVQAHRLERQIERFRAWHIARNEIYSMYKVCLEEEKSKKNISL